MSVELKSEPQASLGPGGFYKGRLGGFLESRRGKMFGLAEVIGLTVSCLVFALVLLSYLYYLVPARSRIASLNSDRAQLQVNLKTLERVVTKEQGTQESVDRIGASLDRFESDYLLRRDQGRMQLYEELNQLIVKNGLLNTSGPTYTPLDPAGTKSTAGGKSVVTKWQSFYPGIAVLLTVEGQYQDVRRFIRDIERSRQFVVINEVELQRATQNNAPVSADNPESGTRASLVSLQLNLATYFKRENEPSNPAANQE